ncbi:hypothetical protein glysoja_024644 [Glycine soja]|uniref:Uncharacterized protein n=1 Tax=Glycine soja TaxID=3848 RepID=A0A0B2PDE2_GLYSO|nr:hypothetical protein JHK87_033023 [Glycine soja]KAG4985484.1 hypothetical protein JHK86_033175 [Glycine max]KHN05678.1 hypothetical protein glysoja_024644 [Glycine soja]
MATEVRRRCFGAMQQQGEERRLGAAARKLSTEATTLNALRNDFVVKEWILL